MLRDFFRLFRGPNFRFCRFSAGTESRNSACPTDIEIFYSAGAELPRRAAPYQHWRCIKISHTHSSDMALPPAAITKNSETQAKVSRGIEKDKLHGIKESVSQCFADFC